MFLIGAQQNVNIIIYEDVPGCDSPGPDQPGAKVRATSRWSCCCLNGPQGVVQGWVFGAAA